VRIVGHASSRTSNMPLEKHLEVIFGKSQDRANAVAQEVIRKAYRGPPACGGGRRTASPSITIHAQG